VLTDDLSPEMRPAARLENMEDIEPSKASQRVWRRFYRRSPDDRDPSSPKVNSQMLHCIEVLQQTGGPGRFC